MEPLCVLCSSQEIEVVFNDIDSHDIVRCKNCGLVYSFPVPSGEELEGLLDDIYTSEDYKSMYLADRSSKEKEFAGKMRIIKKLKGETGKLLDIGCSYGFFLNIAKQYGWNVYGIEQSETAVKYCIENLGIQVYNGLFHEIELQDKMFDVITLWDVLEHVPDIADFLNKIYRVLKEDGLLLLQSPNFSSKIVEIAGSNLGWVQEPDHLYHFSPETMQAILEKNNFIVFDVKTWEPVKVFAEMLYLYKLRIKMFTPRINYVFGFFLKMISFIYSLLFHRLWWAKKKGGLLFVIAKKKI